MAAKYRDVVYDTWSPQSSVMIAQLVGSTYHAERHCISALHDSVTVFAVSANEEVAHGAEEMHMRKKHCSRFREGNDHMSCVQLYVRLLPIDMPNEKPIAAAVIAPAAATRRAEIVDSVSYTESHAGLFVRLLNTYTQEQGSWCSERGAQRRKPERLRLIITINPRRATDIDMRLTFLNKRLDYEFTLHT